MRLKVKMTTGDKHIVNLPLVRKLSEVMKTIRELDSLETEKGLTLSPYHVVSAKKIDNGIDKE